MPDFIYKREEIAQGLEQLARELREMEPFVITPPSTEEDPRAVYFQMWNFLKTTMEDMLKSKRCDITKKSKQDVSCALVEQLEYLLAFMGQVEEAS